MCSVEVVVAMFACCISDVWLSVAVPISWWRAAGFESEDTVPFYTKEVTHKKYGEWKITPNVRGRFPHIRRFQRSFCKQFGDTRSASECKQRAELFVEEYAKVCCTA